jgi:hypothetical protein
VRLPRDVSGAELARALGHFGYEVVRKERGHLRLRTELGGQHHVSIPDHKELRVGTLAAVIGAVAANLAIPKGEVARLLFGSKG